MSDTMFSSDLPIGKELSIRCGNVAAEYVVRFSDGSEVRVTLPPGSSLRVKRGDVVSFNLDLYPIGPDDSALRLVADASGHDPLTGARGR